ncbi:MAG TPA: hypothetical protein VFZ53_11665 [Polyangiaceae bacterium]
MERNPPSAPARALVRGASGAMLVGVVALGVMTYRAVRDGDEALTASDAAFNRGELAESVLYARRAAIAYAPGAPHTRVALERLRAIAVGSEAAGDAEIARLSWGAIRAAALETRHVTIPYAAELDEANERLERLAKGTAQAAAARARAEPELRAALARVPGPSAAASAALVIGFVLALGGLLFVAALGLTRDGRIVRQKLFYGLGMFVAGALLWAIAVYRA